MTPPLAAHRQDEILRRIAATGTVRVGDLAAAFQVSRETIRRDLKTLAGMGRLNIVHGGAARREAREPALAQRLAENEPGKAAIARTAAGLVEDGMVVLLDSGTTTLALVRALSDRQDLTIVTSSLAIAQFACRLAGASIHMLGGEIDPEEEAAFGIEVIEALGRFQVDLAFLGAGGLSPTGEVTDYARAGAEQRARMIKAAARAYFVLDRTKFGRLTPIRIMGFEKAAGLIVDAAPPPGVQRGLAAHGLRLIVSDSS